jgi:hypothetical protein
MRRYATALCLLLTLAVPVQAMADFLQRLPCFDTVGAAASAVAMDCHTTHSRQEPAPADCCGDACPDLTACTAAAMASPTDTSGEFPDGRIVLTGRDVTLSSNAFITPLLRPPAVCHA